MKYAHDGLKHCKNVKFYEKYFLHLSWKMSWMLLCRCKKIWMFLPAKMQKLYMNYFPSFNLIILRMYRSFLKNMCNMVVYQNYNLVNPHELLMYVVYILLTLCMFIWTCKCVRMFINSSSRHSANVDLG